MGETFPRVSAGDPLRISAESWNALMGLGQQLRAGDASLNPPGLGGGELPPGVIWVRNDSGADAAEFAILGIDGILISPTANAQEFRYSPGLSVVTPVAATHAGKWAVLLEPIAAGDIGKARIFGLAPVTIEVTDGDATRADVIDDDATKLQTSTTGTAEILWKEPGTGDKAALIRFPVAPAAARHSLHIRCLTRDAFTVLDDSVLCDVIDWDCDDDDPDPEDAGLEVLNDNQTFHGPASTYLWCEYWESDGRYHIYQEGCPGET